MSMRTYEEFRKRFLDRAIKYIKDLVEKEGRKDLKFDYRIDTERFNPDYDFEISVFKVENEEVMDMLRGKYLEVVKEIKPLFFMDGEFDDLKMKVSSFFTDGNLITSLVRQENNTFYITVAELSNYENVIKGDPALNRGSGVYLDEEEYNDLLKFLKEKTELKHHRVLNG